MTPENSFGLLKKVFLVIGVGALLASMFMTGKFGFAMSATHGFGLMLMTVAAALLFPLHDFIKGMGKHKEARWFKVAGICFLGLEFFADLGYTVGMREYSTVGAAAQQAAYVNEQKALTNEQTNLDMWRENLKNLQAQNAWVTTVSADGLRAQIAAFDKDIELETARGGCKTACLKKMKDKAALEDRIALAEQASDLTKKIEATQRILDKKTASAADVKVGFSPVTSQTGFVGTIYLIATGTDGKTALNPDDVTRNLTTIFIGFFIALGATFLPTVCFRAGFFGDEAEKFKKAFNSAAEPIAQSLDVARTAANDTPKLSIRDAMERGFLALPRAA